MTSLPTKEGHAVFMHPSLPADTECQTWYKVLGDLSSNKRPIIVLHGGPGSTHDSLTVAFDPYASKYDTPVVYYDQLGNGKSTHLRQKRGDEAFWTPELFVAELDNLVRHLGIRDNFDLFGHSWGAKLAAKYAASPLSAGSGLYKIILASGACTQKDMNRATQILIKQLPQDVQDTINKYSKEKNFDAPEYKGALLGFFKKHLCRLDPWPPVIFETVKALAADDTVYSTMLGPDGLNPTGSLRDFDMTEECKLIKQPTLLLHGEYDTCLDLSLQPWFDGIPKVRWITILNASHMSFVEQQEKFNDIVSQFLKN